MNSLREYIYFAKCKTKLGWVALKNKVGFQNKNV